MTKKAIIYNILAVLIICYGLMRIFAGIADAIDRLYPECIQFVRHTSVGFSSGIMYCPREAAEYPYITKLVKLDDSWYYFEEK